MKKLAVLTLSLMSLTFSQSFATTHTVNQVGETASKEELLITGVKIREIATPKSLDVNEFVSKPYAPLAEILLAVDGLLAFGKKLWPIIEGGAPVVSTKMAAAVNIVPNMDGNMGILSQMANWSVPRMRSYRVSFTNTFGMEVVGFSYTVFFQHGGNFGGKGKYIANLKVQASEVNATWGSQFDASSEFVGMSNVGTMEDPIASGIIQISYVAKGVLNKYVGAQSLFVDGAGNIGEIK